IILRENYNFRKSCREKNMERLIPIADTNYERQPDSAKGITSYTRWWEKAVPWLLGRSLTIGKNCVNIKSAARYICEVFLQNNREKHQSVEKIIKNLSKEDRGKGLENCIEIVLGKLADEEAVPDRPEQKLSEI